MKKILEILNIEVPAILVWIVIAFMAFIITSVLTSCETSGFPMSGSSNVTISNNFTGPQGAQGPQGIPGVFTDNQSSVNLSNPNFWGNTTFQGSLNMTSGSKIQILNLPNDNFIIKGSGLGDVSIRNGADTGYGMFRVAALYYSALYAGSNAASISPPNTNGNYYVFGGRGLGNFITEVARIQNGENDTQLNFWQFMQPFKTSNVSVSGPANNVTPYKWMKVYDTDNTTAWIPMYK